MTARSPGWDEAYAASAPPACDIGGPQPAFVRLAGSGLLGGRVLDAGCGTGEHALLAAAGGADAVGVDVSARAGAIGQARGKAAQRGVRARFEVADALDLGRLGMRFGTVIDSGLFHVFDDEARARYVASLAAVLTSGGSCYLLCISDREPGGGRPRRVRQGEIAAAFGGGWAITGIAADAFALSPGGARTAHAWLAAIRRL